MNIDLSIDEIYKLDLKNTIKNHVFRYLKEPITLSSGQTSHYYFDIRDIAANWYYANVIAMGYGRIIKELKQFEVREDYICIGGPESGGIPIMQTLIIKYQMLGFWVRKEPKKYGLKKQVEGTLGPYNIIVDDIMTTGNAALTSIKAIKDVDPNAKILGIYPIIDRSKEFKNTLIQDIKDLGVRYEPLFYSTEFIEEFEKSNRRI